MAPEERETAPLTARFNLEMERLIRSIGRVPQQRTTAYGEVPADRRAASYVPPRPGQPPGGHPVRHERRVERGGEGGERVGQRAVEVKKD